MFTHDILISLYTKMSQEELIREELEAQKKQGEKKKKKISDAYARKANIAKGYVYFLYTFKNILVIFYLFPKIEGGIKPHVGGRVEIDIRERG